MVLEFEESSEDIKQDIKEVAIYIFLLGILVFGGFFALTRGRGLEQDINFTRFTLFGVMIAIFAIVALAIKIAQSFGFNTLKNFYVPIFDPEKGVLPIKSATKFILVTLLIIISLAFVSSFQPESSLSRFLFPLQVGIGEQQVTSGAKVLFGFFNSPAENAFLYMILGILVTLEFIIFTRITKLPRKTIFLIFLLPNIAIGSVAWLQIHDLVSADDSLRQTSHLVFGVEMSATTLLTGTIIIPEILHATNNMFIVMKQEYGQATTTIIFLIAFIILLIATIAVFTRKKDEK